jgi:hypothetical protein
VELLPAERCYVRTLPLLTLPFHALRAKGRTGTAKTRYDDGMDIERRLLQFFVAVAGLVPVAAGAAGALRPDFLDLVTTPSAATHAAYLSGLLLGIGLGFWSTIPAIERHRTRFSLLTGIVVLGGLARLYTAIRLGVWAPTVSLPLLMELVVTPGLWFWQHRVAGRLS